MTTDVYMSSTYPGGGLAKTHLLADDHLSINRHSMLSTDIYESTDTITEDEMRREEKVLLFFVFLILKWILSPFILTGSGLTIVVILKFIKRMTPTHVAIAFLSLAGTFVGIVPLLNLVVYLLEDSGQGDIICGVMSWAKIMAAWLKIWAIVLIAIERFILVTSWKWHRNHWTSRKQTFLCFTFGVCGVLVATIFSLLGDPDLRYGNCYIILMSENKGLVHAVTFPIQAVITFSLVYCYLRIYYVTKENRKNLALSQNSSNQSNFKKEKKTTIVIAIILISYLVGTMPATLYGLMALNNQAIWKVEWWEFCRLLWHIEAFSNNFVYPWRVPEFKEGYRKILCRCFRKCHGVRIVSWHNVKLRGMNLPLEPRREFESSGLALSSPAVDTEAGSSTTRTSRLSDKPRQKKKFQFSFEREVIAGRRNEEECSSEVEVSTIYLAD